ncbi:MAG: pectinesterase family protein [Bacteroidota bacterium]
MILRLLPVLLLLPVGGVISAPDPAHELSVDAEGRGDFRSIQEALDAPAAQGKGPLVVRIGAGLYREQVFIRRSRVTLVGEDRDRTRIVYPVLREEWNAAHGGSDRGAGVVNIDTLTRDIVLAHLTVVNNHGTLYGTHKKHQFAVRGAGTRIMILDCTIRSDGGDALSLWNRDDGMYYHADCSFEGWVDYVCPRGWCYITRSSFFGHNLPSASIWHDGSGDPRQKFVITDSFFDGVAGFPLGRNHLDGQIYLVRCRFSANMADRPFYRPPSSPRPWQWGARHYFHDCHREGGDYAWFGDNLEEAEGSPRGADITPRWTFDGRWDPEKEAQAWAR